MKLTGRLVVGISIAALSLGACSTPEEPGPTGTGGGSAEVALRNIKFQPGDIEVRVGETVTWTNEDTVAHTVTSGKGQEQGVPGVSENTDPEPDGVFDHEMPEGEAFAFTFTDPGTYAYFCAIHPGMTGTVVVAE